MDGDDLLSKDQLEHKTLKVKARSQPSSDHTLSPNIECQLSEGRTDPEVTSPSWSAGIQGKAKSVALARLQVLRNHSEERRRDPPCRSEQTCCTIPEV